MLVLCCFLRFLVCEADAEVGSQMPILQQRHGAGLRQYWAGRLAQCLPSDVDWVSSPSDVFHVLWKRRNGGLINRKWSWSSTQAEDLLSECFCLGCFCRPFLRTWTWCVSSRCRKENVGGAAFATEMMLSTAGGILEARRLQRGGPKMATEPFGKCVEDGLLRFSWGRIHSY